MKKHLGAIAITAAAVASIGITSVQPASAHNRAHIVLPSGACMVVGSEKSVTLPDGTLHDLRPETSAADEIGTAFAADEGASRLQKGGCS